MNSYKQIILFMIFLILISSGCQKKSDATIPSTTPQTPINFTKTAFIPTQTPQSTPTTLPPSKTAQPDPTAVFPFPDEIDPTQHYLFYLHGKIIEDQGLPAVSSEFGEYKYIEILERFQANGFTVISEQRSKDTDGNLYAQKIAAQIKQLIDAGVSPANISVVGASKGAGITIEVSHRTRQPEVNYVLLAICNPENVAELIQNQIFVTGNVLSIYDKSDELAGSCQDLFLHSQDKGLTKYEEIVLTIGTAHGILYTPLDDWFLPSITWANGRNIYP